MILRPVTIEHDAVVDHSDLFPGESVVLCQAVRAELAHSRDRVSHRPEEPSVGEPTLGGDDVGKMAAVLGQNKPESPPRNQLRQRRVEKRCVLMRVNKLNPTVLD